MLGQATATYKTLMWHQALRVQSPEGLAEAISVALGRIAGRATPLIADHVRRHAQATVARQK